MPTVIVGLVGLFVLGGVVYLLIIWDRRQTERARQVWQEVAEELGLDYERPEEEIIGTVTGNHEGHEVVIERFGRRVSRSGDSQKLRVHFTRVRVRRPEPLGIGLWVNRKGPGEALSRLLDTLDQAESEGREPTREEMDDAFSGEEEPPPVDDPQFNELFHVDADQEEALQTVLSSPVRRALCQAAEVVSDVKKGRALQLDDEEMRWEHQGLVKDSDLLLRVVQAQLAVMREINGDE